eukprot:SAG11_NODE_3499_length_2409_cov_9.797403_3_plen_153_part_00
MSASPTATARPWSASAAERRRSAGATRTGRGWGGRPKQEQGGGGGWRSGKNSRRAGRFGGGGGQETDREAARFGLDKASAAWGKSFRPLHREGLLCGVAEAGRKTNQRFAAVALCKTRRTAAATNGGGAFGRLGGPKDSEMKESGSETAVVT